MSCRSTRVFVAAAIVAGAALTAAAAEPPPTATARPEPTRRRRVVSDLSGFELLDAAQLKDRPVVAGATRSLGGTRPPLILAPHLAKLHGARPVFSWQHDAERFQFVLSDDSGEEIHAAQVDGRHYQWPADAPRLADGKTYLWSVKPLGPSAALASMAAVVVVTPEERAMIDDALAAARAADHYSEGLARAEVFVGRRVWYDAVAAFGDLIARFPGRAAAYEHRGMLYAQIAATRGAAEEDFTRADALAAK